jgi:RNA polymerase sigma-70 factor, ECF subfamily
MLRPRDFPETRASLLDTLRTEGAGGGGWREFFAAYAPAVYRVARHQGLAHHDAEDIVQQVMIAIAGHMERFEYDRATGRFRQWVKTIANNKLRDRHRRQAAGVKLEALPTPDGWAGEEPDLDALWDQEWRVQEILACLDQVTVDYSPRRVEAFRLYVLEGVPAEEAARRTGLTRGHVYVTRAEILARVRERLGETKDT